MIVFDFSCDMKIENNAYANFWGVKEVYYGFAKVENMYHWPNMYFVHLRETGSNGIGYVIKARQSAHRLGILCSTANCDTQFDGVIVTVILFSHHFYCVICCCCIWLNQI